MPNEQIYTDQLAIFNGKYNMGQFDLKKLIENEMKFRYVNNFLMKSSVGASSAEQFTYFAGKTLSIYFSKATTLNDEGKYMSSFNAQEFLDDYEELVDAKYRSELQEGDVYTRDKCDGATAKDVAAEFRKQAKGMNKTLPTMWFENLKDKTMGVEKLQATTGVSMTVLNDRKLKNERLQGHLTNVVAAYEAMKQLRESRGGFLGWLWKIFNREQNRQEKSYFNQLSAQISHLKTLGGYDVEGMRNALNGKTVLGKTVKDKEKEAPKTEKRPAKSQAKTVKIQPVASRIANKVDRYFYADIKNEWKENSPDGVTLTDLTLEYSIGRSLIDNTLQLNNVFDMKIANGGDPKKEMERVVKDVFKLTVSHANLHIAHLSDQKKAETIKVLAKGVIENCTAAAIYPEQFGDVVENCLNQSVYQYKTIIREGKDYLTEIGKYDIADTREPAFGDGNLFAENGANKSAQVSAQPKQPAPSIDKK
jgi:hypothetical protein